MLHFTSVFIFVGVMYVKSSLYLHVFTLNNHSKKQMARFARFGAIKKFKKSVGWTIDKFRLNELLAINGTILRFAYRKTDVQRRTFSKFWDFCSSYHRIIAV